MHHVVPECSGCNLVGFDAEVETVRRKVGADVLSVQNSKMEGGGREGGREGGEGGREGMGEGGDSVVWKRKLTFCGSLTPCMNGCSTTAKSSE